MASGETALTDFADEYHSILKQVSTLAREQLLVKAYTLGRAAVDRGLGLSQVLNVHKGAIGALVHDCGDPVEFSKIAHEVLEETLCPFEMVLSGVEEANESLRNVNELLEREARRIAHSLHDEAGQLIATLSLAVECLGCEKQAACGSSVNEVKNLVGQAEMMFRRLSHEMRPRVLDEMGLVPALAFLADGFSQRRGFHVEIENLLADRVCPLLESSMYRMVQVALPNVVKHGQATRATIRLSLADSWVKCSVIDDGIGMDPTLVHSGKSQGLGLRGIQERAKALGGRLEIHRANPHGTEVSLYLPNIG